MIRVDLRCVKVDVEHDVDEETHDEPTDEMLRTEHQVTDAQQVDTAHGIAGTSDKQQGKEVCWLLLMTFEDFLFLKIGETQITDISAEVVSFSALLLAVWFFFKFAELLIFGGRKKAIYF